LIIVQRNGFKHIGNKIWQTAWCSFSEVLNKLKRWSMRCVLKSHTLDITLYDYINLSFAQKVTERIQHQRAFVVMDILLIFVVHQRIFRFPFISSSAEVVVQSIFQKLVHL